VFERLLVITAYGSIVPRKAEVTNLLVPTCIASSHLAYGAYRLESPYMVVGHSAGVAAALALAGSVAVQDVEIRQLQALLREQGQVLTLAEQIPAPGTPPGPSPAPGGLPAVVTGSCDGARATFNKTAGGDEMLLLGPSGLCASVLGYSVSDGAKVVAANCHPGDGTPHHQNQEWTVDDTPTGGKTPQVSICLKQQAVGGKCTRSCLVRGGVKGEWLSDGAII
jgi:hypothetical protein